MRSGKPHLVAVRERVPTGLRDRRRERERRQQRVDATASVALSAEVDGLG